MVYSTKEELKLKKVEKLCKVVVNKLIQQEIDGWPPPCLGTYHQPERPVLPKSGCNNGKKSSVMADMKCTPSQGQNESMP